MCEQRSALHRCTRSMSVPFLRWLEIFRLRHTGIYRILRVTLPAIFVVVSIWITSLPHFAETTSAQLRDDPLWSLFQNNDGLISNDVWSVLIAGDAVWLGTDAGISRYDGRWTNFPHRAHRDETTIADSGLRDGRVVDLAFDDDEAVWAVTDAGDIARWDGRQWEQAFSIDAPPYSLATYAGNLYVATENGLVFYSRQTGKTAPVVDLGTRPVVALAVDGDDLWAGGDGNLWLMRDGDWRSLALPATLSDVPVTALAVDDDHVVWLGTPLGITWFDPSVSRWSAKVIPVLDNRNQPRPVFDLVAESGVIWAATSGAGVRRITDAGLTMTDMARAVGGGLTTPLIRGIAIDPAGSVWFATPVGAFRYHEQLWRNETYDADAVASGVANVNDLLIADDGTVWLATGGAGVRRKTPSAHGSRDKVFTAAAGNLPADGVNTLAEDHEGHIWAGTFAGLARFDGKTWTIPPLPADMSSPVITDLLASASGLWIGTENGLFEYEPGVGTWHSIPQFDGAVIEALTFDGLGRLWVGTAADGIFVLAGDRWETIPSDVAGTDLTLDGVSYGGLAVDPSSLDGMWIHSERTGLLRYNNGVLTVVDTQVYLPSAIVYRLYTDPSDGSLWIGGEGGVSHFDGVTWGTFTIEHGLQSTAVYAIDREEDGAYWFGGPEGLSRYAPDGSEPWITVTAPVGMVDPETGAWTATAGQPFTLHVDAGDLHSDSDGVRLYFRTADEVHWAPLLDDQLALSFREAGVETIEVMARDEAFNYSEVTTLPLVVTPPPDLIELPLLGIVERSVFYALLLLGGTALFGFSYVSYEIVTGRLRSIAAMNRGYNPYVSGEPVRREELFFGRHDMLQRIVDTLHNNSIMIHGERRIGKTTLLYQLGHALREVDDPDYCFIPIYVDVEGTTEAEFFHYLIDEIAHGILLIDGMGETVSDAVNQLRYNLVNPQDYTDRDFNVDLRHLSGALQEWINRDRPSHHLRLILLLDEMDVMSGYNHLTQQQLRRIFMRDFASSLGSVVAGIQISKEWDRVESPWYNLFNEIEMQPFDRDAAIELIVEPVAGIYRYDPAAIEFIVDHSDGRPYRIQQYALEAVNQMLSEGRQKIMLKDVETAHRHIVVSYEGFPTRRVEEPAAPESRDAVPI